MKRIIKICSYILIAVAVAGCFEDPGTDKLLTDLFVSASVGTFQTQEAGSDVILIELSQAATSDVVVNYTITDNNTVNGVDYILDGTSVTIPAGQYSAEIPFEIVGNATFEGVPRSFVINIESVTGGSGIRVDGISEITVTLVDDDCEFIIPDWVGIYTVEEAFTSGVNSPNGFVDFFGETYELEFTADDTDPLGLTAIWTNTAGSNEYFPDGTVMKFEVCDQQISFPGGNPRVADFTTFNVTSSSFNVDSKSIRIDGTAGNFGPYGVTLTKQ